MSIALLPLVVALGFMFAIILDKYQESSEMSIHDEIAHFIVNFGDVLHEIQKERGKSGVYLSSQGKKFVKELNEQHVISSNVIDKFSSVIAKFNTSRFNNNVESNLNDVKAKLAELESIRNNVTAQVLSPNESMNQYSDINRTLLKAVRSIVNFGSVSKINQNRAVYYYFIEGKERAGIERAVLASVFNHNKFSEGVYGMFIKLIAEQDTYFSVFKNIASPEHQEKYNDFLKQPEVTNTQKFRDVAITKGAASVDNFVGFDIDSTTWFRTISVKINFLKTIEDGISENLILSSKTLKANATSDLFIILGFALVLTTLVVVALTIVVRGILNPLNKAVDLADSISKGHLTKTLDNTSQDEVGQLSRALNHMVVDLKNTIFSANLVNSELSDSAEQMSSIAEETSLGVSKQQDELQSISTAVAQMNQTVTQVSKNAIVAKTETHEANAEVNNGLNIVNTTTQSINSLSAEITNITAVVKKLESDTTSIETVLDVIGSIAEQTNLLALNAAIEAARAGEQGRGFAVVADEVRTLAGRTQQATQEIQTMISNLQTGAVAAVSAMEQGSLITKQSVEQANGASESLNSITNAMSTVVDMNEQIAIATEQQKSTIEEIETKVFSIFDVANETAQGANKTNSTSSELLEHAVNLRQALSKFSV